MVPDPIAGPLITKLFELIAAGSDIRTALETITALGLTTAGGKAVPFQTISRVLGNRMYTGIPAAGGAAEPREPARETPAGQELAKLALDKVGQPVPATTVHGAREERLEMLAHERGQYFAVGRAQAVLGRRHGQRSVHNPCLLVEQLERSKLAQANRPRPASARTAPARPWRRSGSRYIPCADGGSPDAANLALRCRAHYIYEAERDGLGWRHARSTRSGPSRLVGT